MSEGFRNQSNNSVGAPPLSNGLAASWDLIVRKEGGRRVFFQNPLKKERRRLPDLSRSGVSKTFSFLAERLGFKASPEKKKKSMESKTPDHGVEDDESDDEARQEGDPMFQALKRGVQGLATQRQTMAFSETVQPGVSRRQRTSATVAAQMRNTMGGPKKPRKRMSKTRTEPKKRSASRPATRSSRNEPKRRRIQDDDDDDDESAILVHFVSAKDAETPPAECLNCDPSSPPCLQWIVAGLTDTATGQRVDIRRGVDVTLDVLVNGEQAGETLVCSRSFPGGLFYFSSVRYTSYFSGTWTFNLDAKWHKGASRSPKLRHYARKPFQSSSHLCRVHYKDDVFHKKKKKKRRKQKRKLRDDVEPSSMKKKRRRDDQDDDNDPLLRRFEFLVRRELAAIDDDSDDDDHGRQQPSDDNNNNNKNNTAVDTIVKQEDDVVPDCNNHNGSDPPTVTL